MSNPDKYCPLPLFFLSFFQLLSMHKEHVQMTCSLRSIWSEVTAGHQIAAQKHGHQECMFQSNDSRSIHFINHCSALRDTARVCVNAESRLDKFYR